MKILIVSTHPTHPSIAGNRKFILKQVELFKSMGHDVYFLFIIIDTSILNDGSFQIMRNYWGEKLFIFIQKKNLWQSTCDKVRSLRRHLENGYMRCDDMYPIGLDKYVKQLNNKYVFDACIINYYILSKLFTKVSFPLMAINSHDYFGYKNLLTDEETVWLGTTSNEEAKAMQRCPHIFALNTEEAIYFKKLSPKSIVYNVFSFYENKKSKIVGNHKLLFLSGKNIYNQNGLQWFLNEIFPAIIKQFPDCTLEIGGGICDVLREKNCNSHIKLIGLVDDEESFYNRGDVVINPTYQGTGLKIKTFEGISYGKILMAHPHSKIGIYDPDNAPLFTSVKSEEWVSFLCLIWGNTDKLQKIKEQCYVYITKMKEFVENEYNRFIG